MKNNFNPKENYELSKKAIGYIARKFATQDDYNKIGFMSGLEVHQQLLTKEKLFCRCPAGLYYKGTDFDAEIIRHMRPTLSELGEYDGTALMEFKTRKEIIYKIKDETTCTYEVDDTPPFPINKEALSIALEISLLCKLNIVGEVHITRKQYLDGSIPTGFQRTAIIGVEGEIPLKNKKVRLIQLSIEEDSCREISDVGHTRVYKTDRLGMPLIETVTYPDCVNPNEVKEACDYIRFLNRSTGKVRTGMGASRQDVNVSCKGGSRVEIKGVAHTKWIPELTHNECFRQIALLRIKDILNSGINESKNWKIDYLSIDKKVIDIPFLNGKKKEKKKKVIAINLPGFKGILSHFTQPGKIFADELSDRLKVIACIEKPNLVHSEEIEPSINSEYWKKIQDLFNSKERDSQLIIWGHEEDIPTAIETIEERCKLAFIKVPNETRKSFKDGTTMFERVLPGADRMYPDTDSAPIPLEESEIEELRKNLPSEVINRYNQLKEWNIPQDTYEFILKKNLFPFIEKIIIELNIKPKFVGTFFGHTLKYIEGHYQRSPEFDYEKIVFLFEFLKNEKIDYELAKKILPIIYEHAKMDFESALLSINFKRVMKEEILSRVKFLKKKFDENHTSKLKDARTNWIMGQLRKLALGNFNLTEISAEVDNA